MNVKAMLRQAAIDLQLYDHKHALVDRRNEALHELERIQIGMLRLLLDPNEILRREIARLRHALALRAEYLGQFRRPRPAGPSIADWKPKE